MAYLFNDPADFADELIEGFVAANDRWVRQVPGGVIRSAKPVDGEVAVVIGGGSGHYPAFAGLVGQGLAHGAAMGNLFASPSAHQIYSVAKAAHSGGGILFSYGNYAGDVLNFDQAQERLNAEGIACRTVVVTDDVSSASVDEAAKRRGIAGDLAVFKAAGAATAAGKSLEEVALVAERANARTRSVGVAFSGCTLPGSAEPLFTVPAGKMAVGMGIHGEPGIEEQDLPTADELAELFVETLLAEKPGDRGERRVAVILNGLGSVKCEELFVVYRRVAPLLGEAGLTIVEPEVGEMVTSFEMAGASLTLFWLDDELDTYWRAPADTAAFRKGVVPTTAQLSAAEVAEQTAIEIPDATAESQDAASTVADALDALKSAVDENVDELGHLDSVAGDGDHGIGMQRGASAAVIAAADALKRSAGAGTLLTLAADAWADRAGGTSGALWGIALRAVGTRVGDDLAPDAQAVADGIRDALADITQFGKAAPGDKTLIDVLAPFSDALSDQVAAGASLADAWARASDAADTAAEATADLVPKVGRARPLAEKSKGTRDPGAVSMALIIRAVRNVLSNENVAQEDRGGKQ